MLKTAASRGAQHARPAFPKARRNVQRPCRRLVKPVGIRAGALRQPQPFQPRHMKLPPACVCPARIRPAQPSGRSCTAAGSCTRPSRKAAPGRSPLSGKRRFAVAGVAYFIVERPKMSTFCPLITTRAASFCKKSEPRAADELRRPSRRAQNIVVAGDGKLSVPGAKPAQYFAILLRCGKPRAAAGKIACEADDIRALGIHNAHQPPQPGCVCTVLQMQVCQVCHAQRRRRRAGRAA